MLKVDRLTKIYKNTGGGPAGGISDASLDLASGDFFTLLGPSGCGKTTTLRCIAGLNEPDEGRIQVGERVINLHRLFIVREGFGREDDMLPERVLSAPEFGAYEGNKDCVISDYEALLDEYYQARGWDMSTGIPSAAKLAELGLTEYQL